jgi:hypothetical protein
MTSTVSRASLIGHSMHRRTFLGVTATLATTRIIPLRGQSLAGRQIKLVVPFRPAGQA